MKQICIMVLLIFLSSAMAYTSAQSLILSGSVLDVSGEPVIGASVTTRVGNRGTITDINGKFEINSSINDVITVRFLGFVTHTEVVKSNKALTIILTEDTQKLDEVVVVGYGSMRRKDLVGSVTSIGGSELKDIPITSALTALTGRLAGVSITSSEGGPDASTSVLVRGAGSITGDNSPLYIVDGMAVNSISDISTADIASIDVLKDASSTAIYGARGANGVVIVTTKSGVIGKAKVTYSGVFGVEKVKKFYEVLNPFEYVLAQAEIQLPATFYSLHGNYQDIDLYKELKGNDWQRQLLGGIGNRRNHTIQLSGGDANIQYSASLNRVDTKDVMVDTRNDFTTLSAKSVYSVAKWLKLELSTRWTNKNTLGSGTSTASASGIAGPSMSNMVQFSPISSLRAYQADINNEFPDDLYLTSRLVNPVLQAKDTYRSVTENSRYINAAVNILFSEALKYRFEYGLTNSETKTDKYWGLNTGVAIQNGLMPSINKEQNIVEGYKLTNLLNINLPNFAKNHNLSGVIGQEIYSYASNYSRIDARFFPTYLQAEEALSNLSLAGTTYPIVTSVAIPTNTLSFFGRVNYDFNKKYLLTATFRADGSSKFAPGNRWGFFPSAGFAWRVSDERFMNSTKDWLSDLKLRASYGVSGNDRIGTNAWLPYYGVSSSNLFLETTEAAPTAYYSLPSVLYNQRVKWETTASQNLGLDFSLFSSRLNGTIEVYNKIVKDLLLNAKIPTNTGFDSQYQNIGQTSNKGVEVTLNGQLVSTKKLKVNGSFNIAFNKNKVDKVGETKFWYETSQWASGAKPQSDYLIAEGQPLGQMFGFIVDGMYTFDDFTYNSGSVYTVKPGVPNIFAVNSVAPIPGTIKYKDLNGDGLINDDDKTVLGNAYPIHTGGFSLNATYEGFDLSTFFNWSFGNSIYNANKMLFTSNPNQMSFRNYLNTMNSSKRFMTIDPENPGGGIITDPVKLYELNKNATMWSIAKRVQPMLTSYDVEDGSFLRLSNITLGYTFSKRVVNFLRISNLRVYSTFSNVWLLTNYTGNDPEVSNSSNKLTPGVDWNAYPRTISANVGVNLTL